MLARKAFIALMIVFMAGSAQAFDRMLCYEHANIGCADTEDFDTEKLMKLSCIDLAVIRQRILEQQATDERWGRGPNPFLIRNLYLVQFAEQAKRCDAWNPLY